jgi:hypothetical protein
VAGYSYGVISINLGTSGALTLLCLLGSPWRRCLPCCWALPDLRPGDGVFFGIVTFATTLALAAFFGQTAGQVGDRQTR